MKKKEIDAIINTFRTADQMGDDYKKAWYHFGETMAKAMRGRICTPERMATLYPIFAEIADEVDEADAIELQFTVN